MATAEPNLLPNSSQVHSIAQWISEFGGSLLFEAGFAPADTDREELMEILRSLEDCREEGRPLYPDIILTSRREECLQSIYKAEFVCCGEIRERRGRIRRALKRCLPLTVDPWAILIEVQENRLVYGVVSIIHRADAPPFHEQLMDIAKGPPGLPVVHLRRHGSRGVLVRTAKRDTVVSLTLSDELLKAQAHVDQFAAAVTSDSRLGETASVVLETPSSPSHEGGSEDAEPSDGQQRRKDEHREHERQKERDRIETRRTGTARIVRGLLEQACREGHGLLACAVDSNNLGAVRAALPDGAYLAPALDLKPPLRDESNTELSVENDVSLRARLALARRMVECDLVTLFSTDGLLLGYNIHVPNTENLSGVVGGARSRAFAALRSNSVINAALMCSQDGQTTIFPDHAQ